MVPAKTVQNIIGDLKEGKRIIHRPKKVSTRSSLAVEKADEERVGKEEARRGLINVTRLALRNISLARPGNHFVGDLRVVQLANGDIGKSHHSRHYIDLVKHFGSSLVRRGLAHYMMRPLGALGIPSDIEVIIDSGSADKFQGRSKSVLLVVGGIITSQLHRDSVALLLGLVSEGQDARGAESVWDIE